MEAEIDITAVDEASPAINAVTASSQKMVSSLDATSSAAQKMATATDLSTKATQGSATASVAAGEAMAGLKVAALAVGAGLVMLAQQAMPVVKALYEMTERFSAAEDAAGDAAATVGTTIEKYSGLRAGIELAGEGAEKLERGLGQMTFRMRADIESTGELSGAMRELGISLYDSNGRMKDSSDVFLDVASSLGSLPAGFERTSKAQEILGRGGAALLPVLEKQVDGLQRNAKFASALGATYTELDDEMGGAFRSSEARLSTFATATENAISRKAMPVFTSFFNLVADGAENVFAIFGDKADALQMRLARLGDTADQTGFDKLAGSIDRANVKVDELNQSIAKQTGIIETWKGSTYGYADAAKQSAEALEKEKFAILDSMRATEADLEARRKRLVESGREDAATQVAINNETALIEVLKLKLKQYTDADPAYQKHIDKVKEDTAATRDQVMQENLASKAAQINHGIEMAMFEERAKSLALQSSASKDLELATLKANNSVVEAERKLAADRATVDQQMAKNRIESEQSVFDAKMKLNQLEANSEYELSKAKISAEQKVVQATQALAADRATISSQLKASQIDAEKGVVDAQIKQDATRLNSFRELEKQLIEATTQTFQAQIALDVDMRTRETQLEKLKINAKKETFDAETSLMAQRAARDESLAKSRIALESAIESAEQARIANVQNADLISEKSQIEAATQTDAMRQQLSDRQLNRTETLRQAQINAELELQGKMESNDALRAKIANATQIALEAHEDVEHRILQTEYEKKKAEAEHNDLRMRGLDTCEKTAVASDHIAASTGAAAAAAGTFSSTLGQCADMAASLADAMERTAMAANTVKDSLSVDNAMLAHARGTMGGGGMTEGAFKSATGMDAPMGFNGMPGAAGMFVADQVKWATANAEILKKQQDQANAYGKDPAKYALEQENYAKYGTRDLSTLPKELQQQIKAQQDLEAKRKALADAQKGPTPLDVQNRQLDIAIQAAQMNRDTSLLGMTTAERLSLTLAQKQSQLAQTTDANAHFGAFSGIDLQLQRANMTSGILSQQQNLSFMPYLSDLALQQQRGGLQMSIASGQQNLSFAPYLSGLVQKQMGVQAQTSITSSLQQSQFASQNPGLMYQQYVAQQGAQQIQNAQQAQFAGMLYGPGGAPSSRGSSKADAGFTDTRTVHLSPETMAGLAGHFLDAIRSMPAGSISIDDIAGAMSKASNTGRLQINPRAVAAI